MAVELDTYLPKIRRILHDSGAPEHEEFLGDGIATDFYLTATPIGTNSEEVYLDGTLSTEYTLDNTFGKLVFTIAPAENVVIKVLYTSYIFSDLELVEYLEEAIEESQLYIDYTWTITGEAPDSTLTEDPSSYCERMWFLILQINMKDTLTLNESAKSMSWSVEGMSVNKTSIVKDSIASTKELKAKLNRLIYYINSTETFTGQLLIGGYEPGSFVGVGESYVAEWDAYE